ncbi:hypothetical protein MRX96_009915 [Rhipicephalus microplus]
MEVLARLPALKILRDVMTHSNHQATRVLASTSLEQYTFIMHTMRSTTMLIGVHQTCHQNNFGADSSPESLASNSPSGTKFDGGIAVSMHQKVKDYSKGDDTTSGDESMVLHYEPETREEGWP